MRENQTKKRGARKGLEERELQSVNTVYYKTASVGMFLLGILAEASTGEERSRGLTGDISPNKPVARLNSTTPKRWWVVLRRSKLKTQRSDGNNVDGQNNTPKKNGEKLPAAKESAKKLETLPKGALARLKNGKGGVASVSLTANGKQAVTGSLDGMVRTWEIPSGRQLRAFAFPRVSRGA